MDGSKAAIHVPNEMSYAILGFICSRDQYPASILSLWFVSFGTTYTYSLIGAFLYSILSVSVGKASIDDINIRCGSASST